jgi:hypothetical protein
VNAGDQPHPVQISLAQALALARLAEGAGEGFPFGPEPLTEEHMEKLDISAWPDGERLHVLLAPAEEWVSLDRAGEVVGRQQATRAEVMTVQLRASHWWSSMRRLLNEKGIDSAATILAESFDDDEDVDMGVLITPDGSVVEWQRRYSDEDPDSDAIIGWRDISASWPGGPWNDEVEAGLELRSQGLRRLRG